MRRVKSAPADICMMAHRKRNCIAPVESDITTPITMRDTTPSTDHDDVPCFVLLDPFGDPERQNTAPYSYGNDSRPSECSEEGPRPSHCGSSAIEEVVSQLSSEVHITDSTEVLGIQMLVQMCMYAKSTDWETRLGDVAGKLFMSFFAHHFMSAALSCVHEIVPRALHG